MMERSRMISSSRRSASEGAIRIVLPFVDGSWVTGAEIITASVRSTVEVRRGAGRGDVLAQGVRVDLVHGDVARVVERRSVCARGEEAELRVLARARQRREQLHGVLGMHVLVHPGMDHEE